MRFPFQAVKHLLLCAAFPSGDRGGGRNISSRLSSPDNKKKHKGVAHPNPPTSTSESDEDDVNEILSPSMARASLGGDGEGDCEPSSGGDGEEGEDSDDADIQFAVNHSDVDQDGEAGVTASNCIAEVSLDDVDEDDEIIF